MQVKNVSARPHHVGDVVIAPGETATIPKGYENAINKAELVPQAPAAPVVAAKTAAKTAAPVAPAAPAADAPVGDATVVTDNAPKAE